MHIRREWLHCLSRPRHTSCPWVCKHAICSHRSRAPPLSAATPSRLWSITAFAKSSGNSFSVVVTARSPEKGQAIVGSIDGALRPDVSFAVVEDVAQDGAFDHVCSQFEHAHQLTFQCLILSGLPIRNKVPLCHPHGFSLQLQHWRPGQGLSRPRHQRHHRHPQVDQGICTICEAGRHHLVISSYHQPAEA